MPHVDKAKIYQKNSFQFDGKTTDPS